jgi:flagellar biosynthesis/type III secretory pathway protein FliH
VNSSILDVNISVFSDNTSGTCNIQLVFGTVEGQFSARFEKLKKILDQGLHHQHFHHIHILQAQFEVFR